MDYQAELQRIAASRGERLTPIAQLCTSAQSAKIAFCGGVVARVVTESAADTTVSLRDPQQQPHGGGAGHVFCAVHGDLAQRYPDVLAPGALVCLRDATLLVTGGKLPPLLIACVENLSELLLPSADPAVLAAAASGFTAGSAAASSSAGGWGGTLPGDDDGLAPLYAHTPGDRAPSDGGRHERVPAAAAAPRPPRDLLIGVVDASSDTQRQRQEEPSEKEPAAKTRRLETGRTDGDRGSFARPAAPPVSDNVPAVNVVAAADDDDEDCLELADGF